MAYCPPTIPQGVPSAVKAASAVLNYGFDLSPQSQTSTLVQPWAPPTPIKLPWLQPGEEVLNLTVSSDGGTPAGNPNITILETQILPNSAGVPASEVVAWVSGGTPGVTYILSYVFTTNSTPIQRVDERSIAIVVVSER